MSGAVLPELAVVVVAAVVVVTTAVDVEGSRAMVLVVSLELVNVIRYIPFE